MLRAYLDEILGQAFTAQNLDRKLGQVQPSGRPDLSDYQCNGALAAAKTLKQNPRDVANTLLPALETSGIFSKASIDGPGFINLTLADQFILRALWDETVLATPQAPQQTLVIDYGGPNVAKPLHVGHLRSAIIGESIKRIARALGHNVISDVHLGDWGTPMGMLIAQLEDDHPDWPQFQTGFDATTSAAPDLNAETLNALYPQAAQRFKSDPVFAERARQATAKLQDGHAGYRALWRHFVDTSVATIRADFAPLGVDFDLWLGESDAHSTALRLIEELKTKGIARESEGALVIDVAHEDDKHPVPPLILQKKDGGVTYGTTDLATIKDRMEAFNPDKIIYVVDQRQSDHFRQVFRAAARIELAREDQLEHAGFGTMNGPDGRPFKTRAGGVMRLSELIQSAIAATEQEAGYDKQDVSNEIATMLEQIGIAAIKFSDLSNPRTSDYVFNLKEAVRFDGKTGPYVQYAFVRASAILDKTDKSAPADKAVVFTHPSERKLALHLLQFNDALQSSFAQRLPHYLCTYAHELAQRFNAFYRDCPVATANEPQAKALRLFLTEKTAETIGQSLDLLAIPAPQRMLRAKNLPNATPA